MGAAATRWAEELAAWAVPEPILAQAPEPPWGYLPGMFDVPAGPVEPTPGRALALAALPLDGSVLDVGCGGGRAALALVPPAGRIVGVDERGSALDGFRAAAHERGVAVETIEGAWLDVASGVAAADVVVCHHVLYNTAAIEAFVVALGAHARERVVCELGAVHPLTYLRPLWQRFWGLDRPSGPSAGDAVAVLGDLGLALEVVVATGVPGHWRTPEQQVRLARRRLCLSEARDPEIAAALAELPPANDEVWALAWPGSA